MSKEARLIHFKSREPDRRPLLGDLPWGRIAVNHADLKLFVAGVDGKVHTIGSALSTTRALTAVQSVNGKLPDDLGNVVIDTGPGPDMERFMAISISAPELAMAGPKLVYQVVNDRLTFDRGVAVCSPTPTKLVVFYIRVNGINVGAVNAEPTGNTIIMSPDVIEPGSVIEVLNAQETYPGIDALTLLLDFKVGE